MRRLQVEFDDDDVTFKTIEYASVYFKKSKKDLAKEMLEEKARLLLEKNPEIKMVIDTLSKNSGSRQ